jgi:hypothetical protein
VNGRRALLSSRLYPGTYIRDALFWGPLALDDAALGYECYQWFAESQLANGQIRTAVPLRPEDAAGLQPQDDEGALLFILASDWLRLRGYPVDAARIERAYAWVDAHVVYHRYVSPAGAFRYWADTVQPDRDEVISHNLGLLCLARRAMVNLGLGGVRESDVQSAHSALQAMYDASAGYLPLGRASNFAAAQDVSALFPEWLSRYQYREPILSDAMVIAHVEHVLATASVMDAYGRLVGVKVISGRQGEFLPQRWFFAPGLNAPGDYQNGGCWPMYTLVMLALAYSIAPDPRYALLAETLVRRELEGDGHTKEVFRLSPGSPGGYDPRRVDYTWNALIPVALRWAKIVS